MSLISQLKQLFAGSTSFEQSIGHDPFDYQGYQIAPAPKREGSQYRVAAFIEKTIDGELKQHHFIRSDVCASETQAIELATQKCKVFIDQMGEQIFD